MTAQKVEKAKGHKTFFLLILHVFGWLNFYKKMMPPIVVVAAVVVLSSLIQTRVVASILSQTT